MNQATTPPVERLTKVGTYRRYPAQSYLFLEGDDSSSVFVVESGLVRIGRTTPQGRRILIELASEGTMFGELGVLGGTSRSATAVTLESSLVLVVPGDVFLEAHAHDHELALYVTRALISRMYSLTDQLIQASGRSAIGRVSARLVELVARLGDGARAGPIELKLTISQEELGQWAGLSREGTAKALRELREREVIETGRNRVTVLKPQLLQRIATQND